VNANALEGDVKEAVGSSAAEEVVVVDAGGNAGATMFDAAAAVFDGGEGNGGTVAGVECGAVSRAVSGTAAAALLVRRCGGLDA